MVAYRLALLRLRAASSRTLTVIGPGIRVIVIKMLRDLRLPPWCEENKPEALLRRDLRLWRTVDRQQADQPKDSTQQSTLPAELAVALRSSRMPIAPGKPPLAFLLSDEQGWWPTTWSAARGPELVRLTAGRARHVPHDGLGGAGEG